MIACLLSRSTATTKTLVKKKLLCHYFTRNLQFICWILLLFFCHEKFVFLQLKSSPEIHDIEIRVEVFHFIRKYSNIKWTVRMYFLNERLIDIARIAELSSLIILDIFVNCLQFDDCQKFIHIWNEFNHSLFVSSLRHDKSINITNTSAQFHTFHWHLIQPHIIYIYIYFRCIFML